MKLGNLKDVRPWGLSVPPGSYTARVEEVEEGTSTNGYPQLTITWTIVSGEYAGAEKLEFMTITEASRGKAVALLKALGIEIPDGEFELKVSDLVGRQAQIFCREEPKHDDPSKTIVRVSGHGKAVESGASPSTDFSNSGSPSVSDESLPF